MTKKFVWFLGLALLVLAARAAKLNIGEKLPELGGQTASGKAITLPSEGAGSERVLIFSFAKSASTDSRRWTEQLQKEAGLKQLTYRVIVLESVPRLVRGMAVAGIKSGIPKSSWDNTILLYKDEALWKQRLGVTADDHSYVALIDPDGIVREVVAGPFTDSAYTQLKAELAHGK